ncbi:MAG: hypothetical protein M1827_007211 [Pycnora praestabilis]|nr:MAG: hypothetical protein M1827_007211 [Pycnora praestabilis]
MRNKPRVYGKKSMPLSTQFSSLQSSSPVEKRMKRISDSYASSLESIAQRQPDKRERDSTELETALEKLKVQDEEEPGSFRQAERVILVPKSINSVKQPNEKHRVLLVASKGDESQQIAVKPSERPVHRREGTKDSKPKDPLILTSTIESKETTTVDILPAGPLRRAGRPRKVKASVPTTQTETITPLSDLTTYAKPLLELSTDTLSTSTLLDFQTWANKAEKLFTVTKIAEASYGEVYRLSQKDHLSKDSQNSDLISESVLKIIPLQPYLPLGAQPNPKHAFMTPIQDVASEVSLLRHMSSIPGFTDFREIRVMSGRLPSQYVAAWKDYKRSGRKTLFPDPGRRASYAADQLWAIIEMQDAGTDLETTKLADICQVWDVFWGVTLTLAKGEEFAKYEHRDLHLGNICVRSMRDFQNRVVATNAGAAPISRRKIGFTNLKTTIIDYTLSRAATEDIDVAYANGAPEEHVAFYDMDRDPCLFEGDAEEEYQYEIYRYMRSQVYLSDPLAPYAASSSPPPHQDTPSVWKAYHPQTNVLWLHFLLHSLLLNLRSAPATSSSGLDRPNEITTEISHRLQKDLTTLDGLLDPRTRVGRRSPRKDRERGEEMVGGVGVGMKCAGDIVAYAVGRGWLNEEDVLECGAD